VKPVREGGMRMSAKRRPKEDRDSTQIIEIGDEEQDDESDEQEVDVKSDGDEGQSQSQQSQTRPTEAGTNNTQQPHSRSFVTASGAATSGLPSEAALSPSHWGNK
jgi:hypothetical protein